MDNDGQKSLSSEMTLSENKHNAIKAWLALFGNMYKECDGQDRIYLNLAIQKLDQNEVDVKFSHLDEAARRSHDKDKQTINRQV
mmetsp:Transcript_12725/g.14819  ORF Transcript_12725/g.14819 Transcript_12725/m.14819 type:complete len:84 (+) Transcript_12725:128-379(+)